MGMNHVVAGALTGPLAEPLTGPLSAVHAQLAVAGSAAERLWLLGGVVLALSGAGVVALAALRGRRD
ncbi:hypothetical protein Y717_00610 [Streptomyces scopuliridis RB72]|uniref:Uncharacterized protein n=2 Tax=Streptomyces scopuliridis TaxID=452529 RepID=A0A2T7TGJ4_9ACTN|nr:hypothetical protein Y717_00610 [Streptomyces scopuliridis RB72]